MNSDEFTGTTTATSTHTRLPVIICGTDSLLEGTWKTHTTAGVSNYADNINCQSIITGPSDKVVQFTWVSTELEGCCDYVYLYNGLSTSSPRIATLSGAVVQPPYTWTSTGNTMTIQFITDISVTLKGLIGTIAFVDPPSSSSSSCTTATFRPSISSHATSASTVTPHITRLETSSEWQTVSEIATLEASSSADPSSTSRPSSEPSSSASTSASNSLSAAKSTSHDLSPSSSASPSISSSSSYSAHASYSPTLTRSINQSRSSHLTISPSAISSRRATTTQSLTTSVSPSPLATPKPMGPPPPLPPLINLSLSDLKNIFNDLSSYEPTKLHGALNTLGMAALSKVNGSEFGVDTEAFSLKIKALDPAAPANLNIGGTKMALPPLKSLGKGLAASMIQWTSNPYEDQSSAATDTLPLSLNVLGSDGTQLDVNNLTTPIVFGWTLDTSIPKFQTPPLYMADCHTNELYVKYDKIYEPYDDAIMKGSGAWNVPCLLDVWRPLNCSTGDHYKTIECPKPILTPNCLYWNTNTSRWSSDGCTPYITNTSISCSCTHLTDFTSRIDAVGEVNRAIFANAGNVYSLDGLFKYANWYGIFGGIALATLLLGILATRIDILATKQYVKQLCQDPVIHTVFDNAPNSAIYVFDKNSTKKCKKIKAPIVAKKVPRVNLCQRVCQQHSRVQFLFRFDPRLARIFRLMALFTIQYHSLFVTALFYGFTYGSSMKSSNSSDMAWYEIIILSLVTTALNIPVVSTILWALNVIGLREFKYKFPLLFEEYSRRASFEKYALIYLDKKTEEAQGASVNDSANNVLDFADEDSLQQLIMMYLCCRPARDEDEEDKDTHLTSLSKKMLLVKMIKVIKAKYPTCEVYHSFWSYMPCHTFEGWLFLSCSAGWLTWCLNYLLLFAAAHNRSVGESVMISYATSELTTVFLSQPISIIISYFAYKLIGKYGQYLPACLQRLVKQSSKNNIPPVYFFSNPWASTAESVFTSKFAYSLFIRCPALASNTNELAYAPTKAIADDIETMPPPCKVEELYRTTMEIKEELYLRTIGTDSYSK